MSIGEREGFRGPFSNEGNSWIDDPYAFLLIFLSRLQKQGINPVGGHQALTGEGCETLEQVLAGMSRKERAALLAQMKTSGEFPDIYDYLVPEHPDDDDLAARSAKPRPRPRGRFSIKDCADPRNLD